MKRQKWLLLAGAVLLMGATLFWFYERSPYSVSGFLSSKRVEYVAHHEEPCGRATLVFHPDGGGESFAVQPKGPEQPSHKLNLYALSTQLKVKGFFTGKTVDDGHCGSYREFYVESFKAYGEVRRCSDASTFVDNEVFLFPENLPKDRFVSIDFTMNPGPEKISLSQCRETDTKKKGCRADEKYTESCDGWTAWCCSPRS